MEQDSDIGADCAERAAARSGGGGDHVLSSAEVQIPRCARDDRVGSELVIPSEARDLHLMSSRAKRGICTSPLRHQIIPTWVRCSDEGYLLLAAPGLQLFLPRDCRSSVTGSLDVDQSGNGIPQCERAATVAMLLQSMQQAIGHADVQSA